MGGGGGPNGIPMREKPRKHIAIILGKFFKYGRFCSFYVYVLRTAKSCRSTLTSLGKKGVFRTKETVKRGKETKMSSVTV